MYKKVELSDGYVGMEKKVAKLWKDKGIDPCTGKGGDRYY